MFILFYEWINGCFRKQFFIDNYYEVGAKWLHGIGEVGKTRVLTANAMKIDNYNIRSYDLDCFLNHVKSISGNNIDHRDVLYFLKSFSNVNEVFCELDYYMHPIVHMNSRKFFSALLSTPEYLRGKKYSLII